MILLVIGIKSHRKNTKQWEEDYSIYQEKVKSVKEQRESILAKAESLV